MAYEPNAALTFGPSNGTNDGPMIQSAIDTAAAVATVSGSQVTVKGRPGVTYTVTYSGTPVTVPVFGTVTPAVTMKPNVILDSVNFAAPDWSSGTVAVVAAASGTNNWGVQRCGFNGHAPHNLTNENDHSALVFGSCNGVTISQNTCTLFRGSFVNGISQRVVTVSTTLTKGASSGTTLTTTALSATIPAAGLFTINDGAGNAQSFTVPSGAAAGATTITITASTVTINTGSGYRGWGTTWPTSFLRITDNTVTLCQGGAIKVNEGVTDCWIERNTCTNNLGVVSGTYGGAECIYLNDQYGVNTRLHIVGNQSVNWASGIVLGCGTFVDISGNHLAPSAGGNCIGIEDTVQPIYGVLSFCTIVRNSLLGSTTNPAISLFTSNNILVQHNVFAGQYTNPVFLHETGVCTNNYYLDNTGASVTPGSGPSSIALFAGSNSVYHTTGSIQVGSNSGGGGGESTMLTPGATGTVLTSAGPSAVPAWSVLHVVSTQQPGTSYTFVLGDDATCVEFTNASAVAATIPPHSAVAFPVGTVIECCQYGGGQVTLTAGAGVTLRCDSNKVKTAAQYATVSLRQRAIDEWVLSGDLA